MPIAGFTPAWARGTATRGTHTRVQYRPHYSNTFARALVGTLRTSVVFSLGTTLSQSLQIVREKVLSDCYLSILFDFWFRFEFPESWYLAQQVA